MTPPQRPLFAVLYDAGAVPAGEIGAGLADLGDIVFLVPDRSAHVEQLRPVMELLGDVRTLTGRPEQDADLVRALAPDAVLTFCEDMIRPAARLAAAAGLPGLSAETAHHYTDKGAQRRALRAAGVDGTAFRVVESPEDWDEALRLIGLPSLVKPVTASRSREAHALRTPEDARLVRARLDALAAEGTWEPFILEEFLEGRASEPFGDYVSVESVCTPSGITHLVLTGKSPVVPPFRGTGRIWPSHLPRAEEAEIFALVTRALEAVGADHGFAHTELKLTPDGPRIIELNGRLSGHVNMMSRESSGLDLVRVGALLALGEEPYLPTFDFGGKVHFQYNNLAPLRPGVLMAVHGAEAVREMPGITAYRNFVRPGDELPGGTSTLTLDTLSGVCEGHEAVMRTIDAARAALTFEFRFDDGVHALSGLELPLY
ncbi:hypothetical protein ACFW81_22495 [Streptomyces angustmyceticus]|uniref:hypothetical protein n=1 Tax=Streptomyces angustmyceticus TaxID=285578 RepID=UPI0036878445